MSIEQAISWMKIDGPEDLDTDKEANLYLTTMEHLLIQMRQEFVSLQHQEARQDFAGYIPFDVIAEIEQIVEETIPGCDDAFNKLDEINYLLRVQKEKGVKEN